MKGKIPMNKLVVTIPVYAFAVDRFLLSEDAVKTALRRLAQAEGEMKKVLDQSRPDLSESEIEDLLHSLKVIKVTLSEFKKLRKRLDSDLEHFLGLMHEGDED